MTKFLDDLEDVMNGDGNVAYTENGAMAFASTKSAVLDFFSNGGALRSRDEASIINVFEKAFDENPLLATKSLFYFRDIRGGQGERRTFRILLKHLAHAHPEVVRANVVLVAEYGRWDDLYALIDTPLEDTIWTLVDVQLAEDMRAERPSLLAKWLASENTNAQKRFARVMREKREGIAGTDDLEWAKTCTPRYARKTRQALNMTPRTYRKTLSAIRRKIGLVETRISQGEWGGIEYDKLPSQAGMQYRKAFYRHDAERYKEFLEAVDRGEKKINTGTLYPYDIVRNFIGYRRFNTDDTALNTVWNNLPNYFEGNEGVRGMVVADVSGSMSMFNDGLPMATSVSLAIYTAERNTGPFAGKYITFTNTPHLITVDKNATISQKVQQVMNTDVGYNTDVKAVFDMILRTAVKGKMSQDDLPTHLYMVSDMEFDGGEFGVSNIGKRLFETIADEYEAKGYKMPFLVFWNVNSRNDQQPMSMDQRGFQLVSGCSPSIFTSLLSNKATSAYDLMEEVLNAERYDAIRVE